MMKAQQVRSQKGEEEQIYIIHDIYMQLCSNAIKLSVV